MASRHNPAPASTDAQLVETAERLKHKTGGDDAQPRAGRTGKAGVKAERPADSRPQKTSDGTPQPPRDGKAPSPAAREDKEELPKPMRDSTS